MNKNRILQNTRIYLQQKMMGESTGHDWFHIERVVRIAKHIATKEKDADLFIVELAALLHDIADWKFSNGNDMAGAKAARVWLENQELPEKDILHICEIVQHISFKGGTNTVSMSTIEGMIVQDADRLDALGAIGIARACAYGGSLGREIYNPQIKPKHYTSFDTFKRDMKNNTTINHFYEKLLLLSDRMHTKTGKKLAKKRHTFMENFLKQFYQEWDGIV